MSYRDCYYWLIPSTQFDSIAELGFVEGNTSDDKSFMIITKCDNEDISHLIDSYTLPSWMNAPNKPRLSEQEVKNIIAVEQTDGTIATGWWRSI